MHRIIQAACNSWRGLVACTHSEQAFRQELAVFIVALPLSFFVAGTLWRWVALIAALLLVLVVELLNTAIEKLADHVSSEPHPAIGRVKDMGSAAVGLSIAIAGLVWLASLAERLGLL